MKPRVLIVDDDPPTRMGLADLLDDAGYDSLPVGTFQEAIHIVRSDPPDLIITDIRLAEYNGLQLVVSSPENVPAIVITGFADPVLETEARRRGADYIVKPVDPRALLGLVERKLSVGKTGFHIRRQWERKQVSCGLNAEVGGLAARIVDVSYGGMRIEIEGPPERTPGTRLAVNLPQAGCEVDADLVWANLIHAQTWALGASVTADASAAEWRRIVDGVPGVGNRSHGVQRTR
jgi:CheY-like chemotaxis protein